jgi:hypothetical protein
VLGEIRVSGLGERLHALGQPHGVAQRGGVEADVVPDAADDHLARVEA